MFSSSSARSSDLHNYNNCCLNSSLCIKLMDKSDDLMEIPRLSGNVDWSYISPDFGNKESMTFNCEIKIFESSIFFVLVPERIYFRERRGTFMWFWEGPVYSEMGTWTVFCKKASYCKDSTISIIIMLPRLKCEAKWARSNNVGCYQWRKEPWEPL